MGKKEGFTLIELMAVVAILGLLSVTAVPFYHTWMQRAYGTEAALMMKQIMDGEIMYFLSNDEFFPTPSGSTVEVYDDGTENPAGAFSDIKEKLHVVIPTGHHLDYIIQNYGSLCLVQIEAPFPLFRNGDRYLYAVIYPDGKIVEPVSMADLAAVLDAEGKLAYF